MKWFKHFTDASDDEFIADLEDRYGWEGYGRWWRLLEIVGMQFKKDGPPLASYPWSTWQTKLRARRVNLEKFLRYLEASGKIKMTETTEKLGRKSFSNSFLRKENGDILIIEIPNLLKIRDEYSKKSGQNQDKVGSPLPLPLQKEGDVIGGGFKREGGGDGRFV